MAGNVEAQLLSESEFKAKLYNTLQKKGILNSLKSQLRSVMVRELQLPLTTPHVISNNDDDEDGFLLQIANDIIVSHLSCHGYKYMLSTFYPEAAGINSDKTLSSKDLMQFLHIPNDHTIAKALPKTHLPKRNISDERLMKEVTLKHNSIVQNVLNSFIPLIHYHNYYTHSTHRNNYSPLQYCH